MERLVEITDYLRSENGCPWDRKQTHESLLPHLIEESHEVVDAIQSKNGEHIKEELGDLLFQICFHSSLSKESYGFGLDDVADAVSEKLIRRHPHVFAREEGLETAEDVEANWEKIKAREKKDGEAKELFHGVPKSLPSLLYAEKIQKKASQVGFDWPDSKEVADKIQEELEELEQAKASGSQADTEEELGDLLFTLVNWARHKGISAESALQKSNHKFQKRLQWIEESIRNSEKKDWSSYNLEQLEELWKKAKKATKN